MAVNVGLEKLQHRRDNIIHALASQMCSKELAVKLYGDKLISADTYKRATIFAPNVVETDRFKMMLDAVLVKVELNSTMYDNFIGILKKMEGFEDVVAFIDAPLPKEKPAKKQPKIDSQSSESTEPDFKLLALHTGTEVIKSVRLYSFHIGMVVEYEYITPNRGHAISLNLVHRTAPADGTTGIDKVFLHIAIRGAEALVLNTAAPWGSWSHEERPTGYPLTPGQKVALQVKALTSSFQLSTPNGNFLYSFNYRPQYGSVTSANEIYVHDQYDNNYSQKIVVGKESCQ